MMICSTFTTQTSNAEILAHEFTAHYESSKGFIKGQTVVSLKKSGEEYQYTSVTTVKGLMSLFTNSKIEERSHWRFVAGKIRPENYLYLRTGSKKRHVKINFNWDNNQVTNDVNADAWKMDIKPGTLDKFIYQLVMMKDLNNLPDNTNELVYSIADGGKLKTYTLSIQGTETVKTDIGEFETIKIVRSNGKRTTTLWCAEKLGYLPVQIRQSKKGSDYTANITRLEGTPGFYDPESSATNTSEQQSAERP